LNTFQTNGKTFTDVRIDLIEEPQFMPGEWAEADFNDMLQSFNGLPAVRRAIDDGTIDALLAADPAAKRVYDWFFGGDSIRVEWYDGRFTISGGKHRITMATQLGLSTVPAYVP
jgi:hypothetical protein